MPWNTSVIDSQILAVHAALLPSGQEGEVLLFGGDEHWADQQESAGGERFKKTRLYDVLTHAIIAADVPSPESDVFCAGHAFLGDGRLLVGGGTSKWPESGDPHAHELDFLGHKRCWVYSAWQREWSEIASFNPNPAQPDTPGSGGRWYPSLVTLGDGSVMAFFGHLAQPDSRHRNTLPERYYTAGGAWVNAPKVMAHPIPPGEATRYLFYPRVFQLPDGTLFFASGMPVTFSAAGDGPYVSTRYDPPTGDYVGAQIAEPAGYGGDWNYPAVLLPLLPDENYRPRVLFCGNKQPKKIDLDPSIASPEWVDAGSRDPTIAERVRTHSNAVLLPTGEVCLLGGVHVAAPEDPEPRVEIYDPGIDWATGHYDAARERWTIAPDGGHVPQPRNYHSTALLLPNGKVWVGGGNTDSLSGDPDQIGIKKIELFEPAYIATPNRLQIVDAPLFATYSQQVDVTLDRVATEAQSACLLRLSSVTHSTNTDQRYVGLQILERSGTRLSLQIPSDGTILPPGYYMLWVLDTNGVPCEKARFVRIGHTSGEKIPLQQTRRVGSD